MVKQKANNIVLFPVDKIVNPINTALGTNTVPQTIDEVVEVTTAIRKQKLEQVMEVLISNASKILATCGITFHEKHAKSLALVLEAWRALLCAFFGLHHPLQDFAAEAFDVKDGKMQMNALNINVIEKEDNDA